MLETKMIKSQAPEFIFSHKNNTYLLPNNTHKYYIIKYKF